MRNAFVPAILALAAALAACESDSGGGGPSPFTCVDGESNFQACGGNPAGEWAFDEACFDFAAAWAGNDLTSACPAAKVSGQMTWSGSATFRDGQATILLAGGTAETHLVIPDDCLQGVDCPGVVPKFTCAAADATCVCDQSSPWPGEPENVMAYAVDGTDLLVGEGAGQARSAFCVKGDWMALTLLVGLDSGDPGDATPVIVTMRRK